MVVCLTIDQGNLKGVRLHETEYLIRQYVDDTTSILDDDRTSPDTSLNIVNRLSIYSGLMSLI